MTLTKARILGAVLALAGACAGPARPAADPEADFRARLGREWALVSLGSREIPPLEARFFRALWGTRRFELDSARPVLLAEDGTRLTFAPAEAGPTAP